MGASDATPPAVGPDQIEDWEQVDADKSDAELLAEYGLTDEGEDTGPEGEGEGAADKAHTGPDAIASQKPPKVADEAADPEASAGEEPAQPEDGEKESQPRDPQGRFIKAADDSQPTPPAPIPTEPYVFRADKTEVKVEGAFVWEATLPDGRKEKWVSAPLAEFDRQLAPYRADRTVIRQERQDMLQRVARAEAAITHHPDVLKARGVARLLDQIMAEKDADKRLDLFEAFEADRVIWEKDQEIAARDKQLEEVGKVEAPADEVLDRMAQEQFQTDLHGDLVKQCQQLAQSDPAKYGVDLNEVLPDLWDVANRIYIRASEDMKLADGTQVKAGQILLDKPFLASRLERHATRLRNAAQAAARAREVEDRNKEVLNGSQRAKPKAAPKAEVRPAAKPDEDEDDVQAWRNRFLGQPTVEIS